MIYGVGTDLIDANRIQKLLEKFGKKFIYRVFSHEEIL